MSSKKKGHTRARNNVRSNPEPLGDVGAVGTGGAKAKAELKTPTQEELRGHNEARVEALADMMRKLTFRTGTTVREKAKEWGITEQRIREFTAIASKRVRGELTDPDRVVVRVSAALERVISDSLRAASEASDEDGTSAKHRKVIIDAAKTLCVLTGNAAPTKHVVSQNVDTLTPDEHLAELGRLKAEIADEERRLEEAKGTLQ